MFAGDDKTRREKGPDGVTGPHTQGNGCVVCGSDQNGDSILLCDGCDGEYHTYCLVPPLTEIPAGDFYCKKCTDANVAKKRKAAAESAAAAASTTVPAGTQAAPAPPAKPAIIMKESKYRGVSKVSMKGVKKPFVAKLWQGSKYLHLGTFSSEIEAAHAYDKAALLHYGKSAQLNFPHMLDNFIRPEVAFSVRPNNPTTAAAAAAAPAVPPTSNVAIAPARPSSSEPYPSASPSPSPGRGRGKNRGRGRGRGRGGKRSQDSPDAHGGTVNTDMKRRKMEGSAASATDHPKPKSPSVPAKKYLGVQVHRVYAHAQIHVSGKTINLGTFATAKDAAIAYDKAALIYFGGAIGSSDAHYDEVVLNFPEKRKEFLEQLIEEEKQKKIRQAGGTPSSSGAITVNHQNESASYASRSAQSAKYNLSIMKLNSWVSKLQRSVKMVEAAQRVQWGVSNVSTDGDDDQDAANLSSPVKTEIFGSGPTIKTEFTTSDQKLRRSRTEIQEAISLMIEELKIYAADAPVDPLFQPPPRCAPILDLLSTSRHLKLISAINELAHLSVTTDNNDPTSMVQGRFESKLQAVVDYRARLQMSSSNEKQKLANFMRDAEIPLPTAPNSSASGSSNLSASSVSREVARKVEQLPGILKNVKYVKRKVPVSKPPRSDATCAQKEVLKESSGEVTTQEQHADEDGKEESAATSSTNGVHTVEVKTEPSPENGKAQNDATSVSIPAQTSSEEEVSAGPSTTDADTSDKRDEAGTSNETTSSDAEIVANTQDKSKAGEHSTTEACSSGDSTTVEIPSKSDETGSGDVVGGKSTVTDEELDIVIHVQDASNSSSVLSVLPKDDYEWRFYLAIRHVPESPASANEWRLLPLSPEGKTGEFVDDLLLTENEVAELEVTEEEVCSSSIAVNGKTPWMEHLRRLHVEENLVRQEIQRETNHEHALQGIVKIEQDRLEGMMSNYRDAMGKIEAKTSAAQKNHARVSQDAQLVSLMQHSFNPILGDLLDQCEEALLNCFRKLSQRFEEFEQEFEYYRTALLNLTNSSEGSKTNLGVEEVTTPTESHHSIGDNDSVAIKRENIANATGDSSYASPSAPGEVMDVEHDIDTVTDGLEDLDSSGLREAYITFYMGEMEALWKERSSSLEMVQAIQRSLLNNSGSMVMTTENPKQIELRKSPEAKSPGDAEMKVEDVTVSIAPVDTSHHLDATADAAAATTENNVIESTESLGKTAETAADKDTESVQPTVEVDKTILVTSTNADTNDSMDTTTLEPEKTAAVITTETRDETAVKTEPKEVPGKFQREKELREAVESCLVQWGRIQWPEELNSTFLTPTSLIDRSSSSTVKTEFIKSQTASDEQDNNFASPYSVMEELKRVMIDLTQDQVVPPPKVAEPTTLVMYHPVFINHQTPKNHPECPERMNRVVNILNSLVKKHQETLKIDRLSMSPEELCPPETTLLMVHSPTYLRQLKERAIEAGAQSVSSPTASSSSSSRALVFESDSGIREEKRKPGRPKKNPLVGAFAAASLEQNGVELDTFVSSKSWDVARAAAGTVCLAVDRVVRKEFHNAVCLVRPPGHHVGRHGRTETAPSSGFCLLNNVVIGATHARLYPWIRKIAVLDWDIHHGNGTEELLKDDPDAFFASIHLYSAGRYFPGTGKSCETGNRINVALENTGAGSGSQAFRTALETKVLPAMKAFGPDIIFISAGFDGHRDDILGGVAAVNNPNVPAGYVEEDYAWATFEVLKLADEVCDGRLVSVLEGGYDVRRETNSLAKSVAAHVAAISTYETARRQAADSASGDVEMKEEEGADKSATGSTAQAANVVVKTEGQEPGLLHKLLETDLDDGKVIIIDDDDEQQEESSEAAHPIHEVADAEDEDTGEEADEEEDVPMEAVDEPDTAMDVDQS